MAKQYAQTTKVARNRKESLSLSSIAPGAAKAGAEAGAGRWSAGAARRFDGIGLISGAKRVATPYDYLAGVAVGVTAAGGGVLLPKPGTAVRAAPGVVILLQSACFSPRPRCFR